MKFNKYFAMAAFIAAAAFTACDDDDDVTVGAPAGKYDVSFVDPGSVVVALTANSFDVTLTRSDASEALTCPIEVISAAGFDVPTSVSFASGEKEATVTVGLPADMKLNTTYNIAFRIPEAYTNPYKAEELYPMVNIPVLKEDYELVSTGTYYDGFWYDEPDYAWATVLEYSPAQDLYRIKDVVDKGYTFFFTWDKETNVIKGTNSSGTAVKYIETPFDYSGYPIVAYVNQAEFTYNAEEKYFTLPFYWYVPALSGGFGIYACYFELD